MRVIFYSLLYRALVQKPMVPENYIDKLVGLSSKLKMNNLTRENLFTHNIAIEILDEYMRKMEYEYMPREYSLFYNSDTVDFAINKRELRMFREKLKTKNWLEAAAEVYYPNKPWTYEMIVNQSRADFLFLLDI